MSSEKDQKDQTVDPSRRKFLTTAGKAATVAPAVGLLLAAGSKGAQAQAVPYSGTPVR